MRFLIDYDTWIKFSWKHYVTTLLLSAIKIYFKGVTIKARVRQTDQ